MLRKITIAELSAALLKHKQEKSFLRKIVGDSKSLKFLKAFVKKIKTQRKSPIAESKAGDDALSLVEMAELKQLLITRLGSEPIFTDLLKRFANTDNLQLLCDNELFPREHFKTAENLLLLQKSLTFNDKEYLKSIFKTLNDANLLTFERFQQVLKSRVENSGDEICLHNLDCLLSIIKKNFKEEDMVKIIASIDFASVCKQASFIFQLPFVFAPQGGDYAYVIDMPGPLFLQILKQIKYIERLTEAVHQVAPAYDDRNRKLFHKIYEAPEHALKIAQSIREIAYSRIDWKKVGASEDEVIQLLADNPEHAKEISEAFCLLNNYMRHKHLDHEYKFEELPSLLNPCVFQAIKRQPKFAKQLYLGLEILEKGSVSYMSLVNIDLLTTHPQFAINLANSICSLTLHSIHRYPNLCLLKRHPEHASALTDLFIILKRNISQYWHLPDEKFKLLDANVRYIEPMLKLAQFLVRIECFDSHSFAIILKHAKYAEKILKILQIDESPRLSKKVWKKNFVLCCQNPLLLDEINALLVHKKKTCQQKGVNFTPDIVEDFLRFKLFVKGIDTVKESKIHGFFGVHLNAKDEPIKNHVLGSLDVVNVVKSFVVA